MELDTGWEREAQYTAGRKTRRNRVLKRLVAATIKLEAMAAARDKGSARQAINGAGWQWSGSISKQLWAVQEGLWRQKGRWERISS